jgi:hypothetical protein
MIIGVNGYSGVGKDTVGIIIQYLNCTNVGGVTIEEAIKDYEAHQWWLEDQSGWEIKKFAGKLKDVASILTGIDKKKFENQDYKKTYLSEKWWTKKDDTTIKMTVRDLLQKLGTDALREGLHENVWVNALMADYKPEVSLNTFRYAKGYSDTREFTDENKKFSIQEFIEYFKEVPHPDWVITDVRFPNEAKAIKRVGGIIVRINRPDHSPINDHPSEIGLDDWKFDHTIDNNGNLEDLSKAIKTILKNEKD